MDKNKPELTGAGNTALKLVGTAQVQLTYNKASSCKTTAYFIKGKKGCLLGRPDILKLGILPQPTVYSVSAKPEIQCEKIFDGMGCLKGTYKIELRADAQPFAIACPRRMPIPLLEKTEAKLNAI